MQKFAGTAEISTRVREGYFFNTDPSLQCWAWTDDLASWSAYLPSMPMTASQRCTGSRSQVCCLCPWRYECMRASRLWLNPTKMQVMCLGSCQQLKPADIHDIPVLSTTITVRACRPENRVEQSRYERKTMERSGAGGSGAETERGAGWIGRSQPIPT